ncbi:HipA domain-containing protein [Corynebacterium sp. sy039]|uniref:HipA domain-containing protein n=1 Tax=Corynebacterium sp. sy039 TaxID=2599641 RepID=UPI0011B82B58|nr:HipA domain-containing protein [Corynebacterium sp. sy039]QDZ42743.1 type II toxin-antitoxin system HipA family toxin [Corynebacterium sp. sy039]
MKNLDVYLYDDLVAQLTFTNSGLVELHYVSDTSPVLSVSLPNDGSKLKRMAIRNFFDNLLPDDEKIREEWAARFSQRRKISPKNPFALLEHMGHDAPGALVILPEGKTLDARRGELEYLAQGDIAARLSLISSHAGSVAKFADINSFNGRFSLSGAQPKIALTSFDNGVNFYSSSGLFPSTHILKPTGGMFRDSDLIEHLTHKTALFSSLNTTKTDFRDFNGQTCLVSNRYDRNFIEKEKAIRRLHQEDMCQAFGISSQKKYESDGGTSVKNILLLLKNRASEKDVFSFIEYQAFSWAVANTDGHAKNFSILHRKNGEIELAPLYDICSFLPYEPSKGSRDPVFGRAYYSPKLAMKIGERCMTEKIGENNWRKLAESTQLDPDKVLSHVVGVLDRLPEATIQAVKEAKTYSDSELLDVYEDKILSSVEKCRNSIFSNVSAAPAAHTSNCSIYSKPLTNPESIARGMGEKCAKQPDTHTRSN